MKKVFMTWMTLCLTVVVLACGSNDPEDHQACRVAERDASIPPEP